ncbi:MAG: sugar ABC transporter permease [Caldilineaceae bacterium]
MPIQLSRHQFQRARTGFLWFMLAPAVLVILFVVLFPLLYSLYLSFTSYTLLKPIPNFVGWKNYNRLLKDDIFWAAFGNTLLFLFVVVNLEYWLGLLLSQLLARTARGQSILRTLLMIPMMFAPVLVGFQFRWFFNDQVGLVNNILKALGLIHQTIPWLVGRNTAMFAVAVADIWMNTPLMAIILLAGTVSLPREPYEAAEVDGANGWQKFTKITYPLLAPFSTIAMTIRSLDVARGFDIVSIMTGGGPAHRTELLWTYVHRTAIPDGKFALGSAMSYVTILVTVGFTAYLFRQLLKARLVE